MVYDLRSWHVISRRNDEKSLRTMLASRLYRDFSAFGYEMTLWDVKCVTPMVKKQNQIFYFRLTKPPLAPSETTFN